MVRVVIFEDFHRMKANQPPIKLRIIYSVFWEAQVGWRKHEMLFKTYSQECEIYKYIEFSLYVKFLSEKWRIATFVTCASFLIICYAETFHTVQEPSEWKLQPAWIPLKWPVKASACNFKGDCTGCWCHSEGHWSFWKFSEAFKDILALPEALY